MSLRNWEAISNLVRESFNDAIKAQDELVEGCRELPILKPEARKETGLSDEEINQMFVFLLKKAIGLLLKAASEGALGSDQSDPAIDFLVNLQGLPMPKSDKEVVLEKLDEIKAAIAALSEKQDEMTDFEERLFLLGKVSDTYSTIKTIWEDLKQGIRFKDEEKTFEAIQSIQTKDVNGKLSAMHDALMDPTFTLKNKGLAQSLHEYYLKKLEDVNGNYDWDVLRYENETNNWAKKLTIVNRMGTALLLLAEEVKAIEKRKSYDAQKKEIFDKSQARNQMVTKTVRGNIINAHVYNDLLELCTRDFSNVSPKTWQIRVRNTDRCKFVESKYIYIPAPSTGHGIGGAGQSIPYYQFSEGGPERRDTVPATFRLEHERGKYGTWTIKACRELQMSTESLQFPRWRTAYWSGNEHEHISDGYGGEACRYKLIPQVGGELKDFRWVLVNKDGNGKRYDQQLVLFEANLRYPGMGTNDEGAANRIWNRIKKKDGSKCYTSIENHTDYVAVLEDAHSSGRYHYENTVWLPNQGWMGIGAEGVMGVTGVYKLTFYRMRGGNHDLDNRVRNGLCLLPGSGFLGLHPDVAEGAFHVIIRAEVPPVARNNISVLQYNFGNSKVDLKDLTNPSELYKDLGNWTTLSGNSDNHIFESVKVNAWIAKGSEVDSHINFKRK
ncbi:hypothetical protein TWF730_008738 [Orbilia blumenaviensis]|uniref:Uncharacterized protein n=1 Tax=Orbilia blumenaviensis TaxID=1796055 RepID=A0AAV9V9S0_9PEZI